MNSPYEQLIILLFHKGINISCHFQMPKLHTSAFKRIKSIRSSDGKTIVKTCNGTYILRGVFYIDIPVSAYIINQQPNIRPQICRITYYINSIDASIFLSPLSEMRIAVITIIREKPIFGTDPDNAMGILRHTAHHRCAIQRNIIK